MSQELYYYVNNTIYKCNPINKILENKIELVNLNIKEMIDIIEQKIYLQN